MKSVQQYIISVIITALVCAVISGFLQNSAAKGLMKMICGLALTLTVIAPLRNVELSFLSTFESTISDAADLAAEQGSEMGHEALKRIIKQEAEAYIQDKAAELRAEATAEIFLSDDDPPLPERAVISGTVSPYVKQQLQEILQSQLGLEKERLEWTG